METLVDYKTELISRIKSLSVINQLVDTIYFDSANAKLDHTEVVKENGVVKKISKNKEYKLSSHRIQVKQNSSSDNLIISDTGKTISTNKLICEELSDNLNVNFISFLNKNSESILNYRFYPKNVFQRVFFSLRNENSLINQVSNLAQDCSWIIVSKDICDKLKLSPLFDENFNIDTKSLIPSVGTIKLNGIDVKVYLNNHSSKSIYAGQNNSISLLLSKNIHIDENKCFGLYKEGKVITMNYTFLSKGFIKKLNLL